MSACIGLKVVNPSDLGRCVFVVIFAATDMDILSHALIGAIIAQLCLWKMDNEKIRRRWVLVGALLAVAPDLTNIPLYLHVGSLNDRFLWLPHHSDWDGYRIKHSWMVLGWEISHSLVIAIIGAWLLHRKGYAIWPALCWASHSIVDIFTHTGEWATVPLWPLYIQIEGFADPWKWTPVGWAFSNAVVFTLFVLTSKHLQKWREGWPEMLLPVEAWLPTSPQSYDSQG
ncbi:MAG: metal-dependent hydrolase [Candidatus Thalassarchaeaceae archaeon]|nr:metal-dependent hydrolase [Candidatus Thalassarchaeaceae archaeon]